MDEETIAWIDLLAIAVGALVAETPANRRGRLLARIDEAIGSPAMTPIGDGDFVRKSREIRALYERLLPNWLA